MTSKKKIRKVLYSLFFTVLVFVLALLVIILYPQPLFINKVEHRQFNVYSNEKIGGEIRPLLDGAVSIIRNSELYDSAYKVDIFLSYNTFFNKIDDKVFGRGPTAKAIDNNLIFKVKVDINRNLVYPTFHKPCEAEFTYLIVHEVIHCLQAHRFGVLKFNPFSHPEMWKLEGYPEYVARRRYSASSVSLKKDIARFITLTNKENSLWISGEEGGCEAPDYYYKGRLMIEYLLNVRKLTYDQVLVDKRSEKAIYSEMVEWTSQ